MSSKRKERNSLVGPILLIGVGLIFLFNNLGWLDWSIWQALWQLWPLLLIISGLDLIVGRRSAVGSALVAVLAVMLLVGGVWFVSGGERGPGTIVDGQSIVFPAQGADRAEVRIGSAAGELYVSGGASSSNVMDGQIQSRRGEIVRQSSDMDGNTLEISLEASGENLTAINGQGSIWDLKLNQEIPLDLAISTGVGESVLDLRRLTVTGLDLSTGVGNTTVRLPRRGGYTGEISGGIGRIVVQVPDDLPVRLEINTGIGGQSVPGAFRQEGDVYFSPAYGQGADAVELEISGGIGSIQVESLPAE